MMPWEKVDECWMMVMMMILQQTMDEVRQHLELMKKKWLEEQDTKYTL
jgi:hypothetical protein